MIYNQLPATTCNKYQIYYLEQKNLNTRRICFYSCTVFKTVKLIYAIRRVIPGVGEGNEQVRARWNFLRCWECLFLDPGPDYRCVQFIN